MNAKQIRIASPCSARWEDMTGDEKCRFCAQCEKPVYNFSAMTMGQIEELIRVREGKVCARFYQRPDGTMLTANCPVGAERVWHKAKALACSLIALFTVGLGTLFAGETRKEPSNDRVHTRVERERDRAARKVKTGMGTNQPAPLLGEVCVVPPRKTLPPVATNSVRPLMGRIQMPSQPEKSPKK